MKTRTRKGLVIAALVIGAVAIPSGVFIVGNAIEDKTSTMQAATGTNDACQQSGGSIVLTFADPAFDSDLQTYTVSQLTMTNIDSSCLGRTAAVTVLDASDNVIAEVKSRITGSEFSTEFEPVAADLVDDVAIVIYQEDEPTEASEV